MRDICVFRYFNISSDIQRMRICSKLRKRLWPWYKATQGPKSTSLPPKASTHSFANKIITPVVIPLNRSFSKYLNPINNVFGGKEGEEKQSGEEGWQTDSQAFCCLLLPRWKRCKPRVSCWRKQDDQSYVHYTDLKLMLSAVRGLRNLFLLIRKLWILTFWSIFVKWTYL